jgi:hypothetical protein
MGNIMVRMGVVIGILAAVQMGFLYVGHLGHPTVIEPQVSLESFPLVVATPDMGTWKGQTAELDKRTFDEAEVDVAVSRIYSKDGQNLKFLLAEYRSPRAGLYHNPMNCYYTNGFTQIGPVEMRPLTAPNRPDTKISVTTWVRNGEKVIVAYWYEVGDHTMFERHDLLPTQWKMIGKTKWPAMFKVLLEVPAGAAAETEQSTKDLMNMANVVREWLGHAYDDHDGHQSVLE